MVVPPVVVVRAGAPVRTATPMSGPAAVIIEKAMRPSRDKGAVPVKNP